MMIGLTPGVVRAMTLADFVSATHGFADMHKPRDQMTEEEALDFREELWPDD